jgi:hypothetical protein
MCYLGLSSMDKACQSTLNLSVRRSVSLSLIVCEDIVPLASEPSEPGFGSECLWRRLIIVHLQGRAVLDSMS